MARKKITLALVCCLLSIYSSGQNDFYIGLDIGPKFDQYRLATGGTRPYHPSMKIYNPLAATFGIMGGIMLEDKYQVEIGIYKSDYRVNIDLLTENGDVFFANTPINTFTTYMIPFNFNAVKTWQGTYEPRHFIYGTGFTILAGTKMGLSETFVSPEVPINPLNSSEGSISYVISNNSFDAKIIMLNLNLGYQYPMNESVNINISMNSKIGIAGNNFFDITHKTPKHNAVKNSVYTTGTSVQFNIGFRYFITEETETI
ncbi:MAG: hypothetical protein ACI9JN_002726 [Bacteroidia bacterium]|jgi:hypothetical protein